MKITIPEKEIEICDVCQRESSLRLDTCLFCGGRYCYTCRAIICGCVHEVDVCRKCDNNPVLLSIVMKHAAIINSAIEARDAEIVSASMREVDNKTVSCKECGSMCAEKSIDSFGVCEVCNSYD